jgi:hypothetical protein
MPIKTTLSVYTHVTTSEQLNGHEIWYWGVWQKTIKPLQFWLKSANNKKHFTQRPTCNSELWVGDNINTENYPAIYKN